MKSLDKEKYLSIAKYLFEQGTDEDIRICAHTMIDYYKQVLTNIADEIGIFEGIEKTSIKYKLMILGSRISEIHEIKEFDIVEKLRNKITHVDNYIPNKEKLQILIDRANTINNDLEEKCKYYLEKRTKIKSFEEFFKTLFNEILGELNALIDEFSTYPRLENEANMFAERRNKLVTAFKDVKPNTEEGLQVLINLTNEHTEAKILYHDIELWEEEITKDTRTKSFSMPMGGAYMLPNNINTKKVLKVWEDIYSSTKIKKPYMKIDNNNTK